MIDIALRLRPFSHTPHTLCLIPGTDLLVTACPARILVTTLSGEQVQEIIPEVQGPLHAFTVVQDLERGCVTLFSEAYRMHLLPSGAVVTSKNPHLAPLASRERLSLGNHKKQDWDLMKRRGDFRELLPVWFRLGSLYQLPEREEGDETGVFALLHRCREAVAAHQPEQIVPHLRALFLAGFRGLFVPRLQDEECQGILPGKEPVPCDNPLYLLQEGAQLIRSLFLATSGNECALLPNLPPEFCSGRMTQLEWPEYGALDLEWTKKAIRRVCFRARCQGKVYFHIRSPIRSFRLRLSVQERGIRLSSGEAIEIKSGCQYLLDKFQK